MRPWSTIAKAWAGHAVGFDYLRHAGRQYAAFYDGERRLTLASCSDGGDDWALAHPPGIGRDRPFHKGPYQGLEPLSNQLPWDSHNYVTMAIDQQGYLHVSGNMHCDPLVYYRSTRPHDIHHLERLDRMTGEAEDRCTYPLFLHNAAGELVFRYRQGSSGNGADYYNIYDATSRIWRRLLDKPLLDGLGRMNAYAGEPVKGPDGFFHMIWVWRDTGDCATNHDLSYMRSPDLVHWSNAFGQPLDLPVVLESDVVVDPVAAGGGLLNNKQWIGFDPARRPVISYTRFDEAGHTQAYCARMEDGEWLIRPVSNWRYRWEFSGGGCIPNGDEIRLAAVAPDRDGSLRLLFNHIHEGSGVWRLDPDHLSVVETLAAEPACPQELTRAESPYPGMQVRILPARDNDRRPVPGSVLRWETLGVNRDKPRTEWPPPSDLRCYHLDTEDHEQRDEPYAT